MDVAGCRLARGGETQNRAARQCEPLAVWPDGRVDLSPSSERRLGGVSARPIEAAIAPCSLPPGICVYLTLSSRLRARFDCTAKAHCQPRQSNRQLCLRHSTLRPPCALNVVLHSPPWSPGSSRPPRPLEPSWTAPSTIHSASRIVSTLCNLCFLLMTSLIRRSLIHTWPTKYPATSISHPSQVHPPRPLQLRALRDDRQWKNGRI